MTRIVRDDPFDLVAPIVCQQVPWLNEDVDHVTVLVDGPPEILEAK